MTQAAPKSQAADDVFAARKPEAIDFLEKLRPGGPWVLTAIMPDGLTTTITALHHGSGRGLHPQARRQAQSLLLSQSDADGDEQESGEDRHRRDRVALADLDPEDGETSEAAKARYLEQLEECSSLSPPR